MYIVAHFRSEPAVVTHFSLKVNWLSAHWTTLYFVFQRGNSDDDGGYSYNEDDDGDADRTKMIFCLYRLIHYSTSLHILSVYRE